MLAAWAGAFNNVDVELEVLLAGVPDDLRKLTLGDNNLVHHWIGTRDIKLRFYHERQAGMHAYIELNVEVKSRTVNDLSFKGIYQLGFYEVTPNSGADGSKTLKARGEVTCSIDG